APGFRALGLRDAAGERDERLRSVLALQTADLGIGLVRRLLADVAGVEHDQVGVVALGGRTHALRAEQLGHPLAVIDVHLAAEAFDFESLGSHSLKPIGDPASDLKPSASPIASRAAAASSLRSPVRSSGPSRRIVTGSVPRRPRIRSTLAMPASCHQPTSALAAP